MNANHRITVSKRYKTHAIILFILGLLFFINQQDWLTDTQWYTLSITTVTAILWMTEWLPIPVSSLIPLATLPLFGVLTPAEVGQAYGSPLILLLLGGFLLSTAMEHSHTHLYLAHRIINRVGNDHPKRLILGFMLTSSLLSMWISNTATTLMLLPIATAIIASQNNPKFGVLLLLSIAYAASIGGTTTPIGTPPNLIMIETLKNSGYGDLGFIDWIQLSLPVWLIFFPLMYWLLNHQLKQQYLKSHQFELKPMTTAQKRVLLVFILTAILWITRTAPYGGWKSWLNLPQANDASVALLAVVLMFSISNGNNQKLLSWQQANKIPWGVLLLFAGGIAIASAFKVSGLSAVLAGQLLFLKNWPLFFVILTLCLMITFLTELTSNTATTAIIMPILLSVAQAMEIDPMRLMFPAVISASCAFMLPVATAPNAIIYGSGQVPIKEMMNQGFKLNVIGAFIIALISTYIPY